MDGSLVWSVHTHQSGTLMPSGAVHPIIPGRAEGASLESNDDQAWLAGSLPSAACAAANRAIGTRNGEHET